MLEAGPQGPENWFIEQSIKPTIIVMITLPSCLHFSYSNRQTYVDVFNIYCTEARFDNNSLISLSTGCTALKGDESSRETLQNGWCCIMFRDKVRVMSFPFLCLVCVSRKRCQRSPTQDTERFLELGIFYLKPVLNDYSSYEKIRRKSSITKFSLSLSPSPCARVYVCYVYMFISVMTWIHDCSNV